jgi:hypothetical protein
VAELEEQIEALLYEDEGEASGSEEEDVKAVRRALELSWRRLELMERRGFKAVSRLRALERLRDTALEWDEAEVAGLASARGEELAGWLHGPASEQAARWRDGGRPVPG